MTIMKTFHVYVTKQEAEIIGNFCAFLNEMDSKTQKELDDAMGGDLRILADKAEDLNYLIEVEEF